LFTVRFSKIVWQRLCHARTLLPCAIHLCRAEIHCRAASCVAVRIPLPCAAPQTRTVKLAFVVRCSSIPQEHRITRCASFAVCMHTAFAVCAPDFLLFFSFHYFLHIFQYI
jgi:hypothetical protein